MGRTVKRAGNRQERRIADEGLLAVSFVDVGLAADDFDVEVLAADGLVAVGCEDVLAGGVDGAEGFVGDFDVLVAAADAGGAEGSDAVDVELDVLVVVDAEDQGLELVGGGLGEGGGRARGAGAGGGGRGARSNGSSAGV
jgi:hypothetical protein